MDLSGHPDLEVERVTYKKNPSETRGKCHLKHVRLEAWLVQI